MTDYIAYLLQEQEEQEERRAESDWRKAWEETTLPVPEEAGDHAGDVRNAVQGTTDSVQRDTAENAYLTGGSEASLESGNFGASGQKTGGTPDEAAEFGKDILWDGVEAGARADLPGVWIYQALRQSVAEMPAVRRESRAVTIQKPGEREKSGGWDAAGLDRLVRRDARRFDGGFQLL